MEAATFLKLFEGHPGLAALRQKTDAPPGEKIHLKGIFGSALTILAALLFRKSGINLCVILPEREDAAYFYDDLVTLGLGDRVLYFPSSY